MKTAEAYYNESVSAAGLYGVAFLSHKSTPYQRRKLAYLWRDALDREYGIAVISEQGHIRVIDYDRFTNEREYGGIPALAMSERRIPAICYIIQHNPDSPEDNELSFDTRRKFHYSFNPAADMTLTADYASDLVALLF